MASAGQQVGRYGSSFEACRAPSTDCGKRRHSGYGPAAAAGNLQVVFDGAAPRLQHRGLERGRQGARHGALPVYVRPDADTDSKQVVGHRVVTGVYATSSFIENRTLSKMRRHGHAQRGMRLEVDMHRRPARFAGMGFGGDVGRARRRRRRRPSGAARTLRKWSASSVTGMCSMTSSG